MQRLQRRTDEFRVRKELLKATYVTARAEVQVAEEIPVDDPGPTPRRRPGSGPHRRDPQELGRQPLPDGLIELRGPGVPATARSGSSSASSPPAPPC